MIAASTSGVTPTSYRYLLGEDHVVTGLAVFSHITELLYSKGVKLIDDDENIDQFMKSL
jgi:hypothetical protein